MESKKIKPHFKKKTNPRVGLIVLATDVMIEKDFLKVFSKVPADLYVNRITNYNPVTADNLKKMENKIEFSIQDLVITLTTPISFIIAGFIIFGIIFFLEEGLSKVFFLTSRATGRDDLIASVFGDEGMHTRAAVSVNSLPLGVAVEVDAIFELN